MGKVLIIKGADFSAVSVEQITQVVPPVITIDLNGNVTMTAANATAIYYTTDGSTPSSSSTVYVSSFSVTNNTTVKAIAKYGDDIFSEVSSKLYLHTDLLAELSELSENFTNGYKTQTYTTTDRENVALDGNYDNWAATGKISIPSGATTLYGKHSWYDNQNSNLSLPAFIFFNSNDDVLSFVIPSREGATILNPNTGADTLYKTNAESIPSGAVKVVIQAYTSSIHDQYIMFQ